MVYSSDQIAFLFLYIPCLKLLSWTIRSGKLLLTILLFIVFQVFCHLLIGHKLTDSAHSVNIYEFQVSFLNLHTHCVQKARTKVQSKHSSNIDRKQVKEWTHSRIWVKMFHSQIEKHTESKMRKREKWKAKSYQWCQQWRDSCVFSRF